MIRMLVRWIVMSLWRIVFLAIGLALSLYSFGFIMRYTENPLLAFGAFVAVMAYWIGTLKTIITGKLSLPF